jgi:hypothetical protein
MLARHHDFIFYLPLARLVGPPLIWQALVVIIA